MKKFKLALLCGGPSLERGISLNSARSVCDHLQSASLDILPIYFDQNKKAYKISRAMLYSNTPSDFDFKLAQNSKPLNQKELVEYLKKFDLVFPVIHGKFGEDGEIQELLEKNDISFVGSSSNACKKAFDKYNANEYIKKYNFHTLPSVVIKKGKNNDKAVRNFFIENKIKKAIVKPANGGSSIAVYVADDFRGAIKNAQIIFDSVDDRVVIEPFCRGIEFTVIILQNRFGQPVSIIPTEIEIHNKDYNIFDYRKKYLATRQVTYHCPPRFDNDVIERIQIQAQQIFTLFGMRDFARFDGWLLPDGKIWFSDFNPISGMEQNSFLFMQSAKIGMSHGDFLSYVVKNACRRYNLKFPKKKKNLTEKKKINVIFGGDTAERQVSVMSGTNAWLKLKKSKLYSPEPYLLDIDRNVWHLPYSLTLNHTVEEITETCKNAPQDEARLKILIQRVIDKLSPESGDINEKLILPKKITLKNFIKNSKYVFIGLHGGIGEDGTLQAMLEKAKLAFNGSGSASSKLSMDKYMTGEVVKELSCKGIYTAKKKKEKVGMFKDFAKKDFENYWKKLLQELNAKNIIVKPVDDGCSSGIAQLHNSNDLGIYIKHIIANKNCIENGLLKNQHGIIEMPSNPMKDIMFEEFIVTDKVKVVGKEILWQKKTGYIEITMGLIGKKGKMQAMKPSMTVAMGSVLTLEEKFQGGTGINITPPPEKFVPKSVVEKAMKRMEIVANALGVENYVRIDAFMNIASGELIIIEANTTPALTPSTVIFHQALAENPPIYPVEFLENIIRNSSQ
ncbi:MAG: hypothetical protein WA055_01465 [Candidatus Moraniibacteriota bacterium]